VFLLFFQNILSRVAGCRLVSVVEPKARIEVNPRVAGSVIAELRVNNAASVGLAIVSESAPKWRIETGAYIQ